MRESREAKGLRAKLAVEGDARKITVVLAIYAIATPLVAAEILAAGFASAGLAAFAPAGFLTALAMTLLGPGLAVMTLALRGHGRITADLVARGDGETRQAILRLFTAGAVLAYLGLLTLFGAAGGLIAPLLAVNVAGILSAWLLLVHLMAEPSPSTARRVAGMLNDVVLVSVFLHIGGVYAAPWFSIYFWVILGFGFRFGVMPLVYSAVLSIAGFATVYATTPFWQSETPLAAGVLLALLLLPAYAAGLIRGAAAARRDAATAAAERDRFLAIMSRELRAPLGSLIGTGSLLARTKLDTEQRSLVATVQHAARALLGLVNDLLDLSTIEAGQLAPETESFVLHEVMGGAVAVLRSEAEIKGQALTLRIDPRLPHVYRGWPLQLRQVVVNLLANAVKFTPGGHIAVTATRATQVENRATMIITVRDDGVGIPKEAQASIFEIFAEGDGGARRYGGTGLGLAIAKQLVELMGGTLTLDSEPGKGSTFAIRLTLQQAHEAVRSPDLLGHKLVVISSDNELAGMMETRLTAWRAEVQWVADSETALGELALAGKSDARPIVFIDGRDNPLAALSLAHRSATAMATPPLIFFLAPAQGGEAITRLAASSLAAVVEAPMTEADLAGALLGILAGQSLGEAPLLSAVMAGDGDAPGLRDAGESATPAAARRRRILVADDSGSNRAALKTMLESAGHEVELAADGEAALAALDGSAFDLALLDITMPEISGYEVAKLYRVGHIGEWRLPIIALTADTTTETERLCREAGMDGVVTKPVDAAQLLAEIDGLEARAARPERIAIGAPRVVTPITAHPRFMPESAAVVDEDIFAALRKLGGHDFVVEVIETFRKDAWLIIERLKRAAEAGDLRDFRELMHSLRSGAVNVGGVKLCQALTGLRDISARELSVNGASHVEKLKAELARLDAALDQMMGIQRRG
ncbi:MAG TPA: ATP-binding protein [Stellaceae bacterium]|nr:ATP-binding protein [Stellaceae bacterium]